MMPYLNSLNGGLVCLVHSLGNFLTEEHGGEKAYNRCWNRWFAAGIDQ